MTLKDIASELNISPSTVSRVLSGQARKYRISGKTEQRVNELVSRHGFTRNQIARNLRLQKTDTIGLVIPDISNPFFSNLARTLEEELRKHNKMILLCDTLESWALEKESIDLLVGRKVDGLLVSSVGLKNAHLNNLEVPTVLIDRYYLDLDIPYIATNNFKGAYHATTYLLKRGHQRIACLQGLKNTVSNSERIRGYEKAIADFHLSDIKKFIIGEEFSFSSGYKAAVKILSSPDRPTAFLSLGNQIALGALQAIKELGYRVPEDISLITFDEQPYFQLTDPPVSTINQPVDDIARKAVSMLISKMKGEDVKSYLLEPKLIERNSVITKSEKK